MLLIFQCINQSQTSFAAVSGRLTVGGIRKDEFPGNLDKWSWFLSGVAGPTTVVHGRGFGDDLDACKAALQADWCRWLDLAGLQERVDGLG
jgi:hypothetical protein